LGGLVKVYDEYYHTFKTNIKLQISALERIVKHLNKMMEEEKYNEDTEYEDANRKNTTRQLKKDKTMIVKEIETLKKLLLQ
jgi:hypothetical protein